MKMRISEELLTRIHSDLGIDSAYVRGQDKTVHNCWHFSTDGNDVDYIYRDDRDLSCGMNRIYFLTRHYNVVILAFCLMDTHVHFILYGEYRECNGFVHEYIRMTSVYFTRTCGVVHKLGDVRIGYQAITDDRYLKTAICYVVKNPPVAGMPYTAYDYPWSSGGLYFRNPGLWTSPGWTDKATGDDGVMTARAQKALFHTKDRLPEGVRVLDCGLIFPGEYVAWEVVESLFRTCRSFNHFMCVSKDSDVESRRGAVSVLTIPLPELRKYRDELALEYFGSIGLRGLDITRRIRLARVLKSRYNSSVKQICRVCGLIYDEAKSMI